MMGVGTVRAWPMADHPTHSHLPRRSRSPDSPATRNPTGAMTDQSGLQGSTNAPPRAADRALLRQVRCQACCSSRACRSVVTQISGLNAPETVATCRAGYADALSRARRRITVSPGHSRFSRPEGQLPPPLSGFRGLEVAREGDRARVPRRARRTVADPRAAGVAEDANAARGADHASRRRSWATSGTVRPSIRTPVGTRSVGLGDGSGFGHHLSDSRSTETWCATWSRPSLGEARCPVEVSRLWFR